MHKVQVVAKLNGGHKDQEFNWVGSFCIQRYFNNLTFVMNRWYDPQRSWKDAVSSLLTWQTNLEGNDLSLTTACMITTNVQWFEVWHIENSQKSKKLTLAESSFQDVRESSSTVPTRAVLRRKACCSRRYFKLLFMCRQVMILAIWMITKTFKKFCHLSHISPKGSWRGSLESCRESDGPTSCSQPSSPCQVMNSSS